MRPKRGLTHASAYLFYPVHTLPLPCLIPGAVQARTFLGLCQVSMGEIQLGASNYERVLRQDPDNLEACVYLAQARKEVFTSILCLFAYACIIQHDGDGSRRRVL